MTDSESAFRVEKIDHVELFVPDREEAARWYRKALGLEIVSHLRHWADDPRGPLMLSTGSGAMLALFAGPPQGDKAAAGFIRLAFRVDGPGFRRCREHLAAIVDGDVTESDHGAARSLYFRDPWGNPLEVTTYAEDGAGNG